MAERQKQKRRMPEVLIITPESLHLLLAQKGYPTTLSSLKTIAVDEWHELMGSKRGVQTELALSRIAGLQNNKSLTTTHKLSSLSIWGISATIGNLIEARDVILAPINGEGKIISAKINKLIEIESIYPDEIEKYPWAGHLGIKLADKVLPILEENTTTLIFINTRSMSEQWYQQLLNINPELSGLIALHHGSIERELRDWVEEALHTNALKAVVSTSSLDLGVDFRPVEMVIQVGSPKGVARFLQRAGRSGHKPDATSKIYFLPTHSLELMEAAALKEAVALSFIESREPLLLCYDVLIQYLCTLAISEGFYPDEIYNEIIKTNCYKDILPQEVSDSMIRVKFVAGGYIGMIEESFISRLKQGDTFTLAGRILEFVMIKEMTAMVRKSNAAKATFPSWAGGRMPLSANLGFMLRKKLDEAAAMDVNPNVAEELLVLKPLFDLQKQLSAIPESHQLLIEHISDQPIPLDDSNVYELFSENNLFEDIQHSVNSSEMAKRKFRDIATIGGLIFQGRPGQQVKAKHLQSSASLLFNVFSEYDPSNLLIRQAYNEVMYQQMDEVRLRNMLNRIQQSEIIINFPNKLTPFCFPIKVDSMRENITSEKLSDRIKKMQQQLAKDS